jgi:A/G-specific adenine glycosylase
VSEIMLQQTRVETVIPFYERFLARFPDVGALASAPEADVLAAWSGLGYYRRARNMMEAARAVADRHASRFPEDLEALVALPGIGRYTAAALQSIAFDRPAAAVDGNVVRVLARIFGLRGRGDDAALRGEVARLAEALARGPRAGDWTQALMELGALICLPRDPRCERCPVSRSCAARRTGTPERFPEARAVKRPRAEERILLVARSGARVLLVPDDRDSRATWTLPYASLRPPARPRPPARLRPSAVQTGRVARAARALAAGLFGKSARPDGPHAIFRHRTFSHSLTYEVWSIEVGREDAARTSAHGPGGRRNRQPVLNLWVTPKVLERTPVRAHTLKALRKLGR